MNKEEAYKLFQKVKANRDLLTNCKKHSFDKRVENEYYPAPSQKWQCSNCKGIVGLTEKVWYEKGLRHGGLTNDKEA